MSRLKASSTHDHEHALTGEKLSLLAVFAHPEDESFGPAGTLAKYASEGVRVSLVTASRELPGLPRAWVNQLPLALNELAPAPRETLCSCRASGTNRMCLMDRSAGKLDAEQAVIEERLVRLMRELEPQVVVTYGPDGLSGDADHVLISQLTTQAFHAASDPWRYPQQLRDGLRAHQPQKLYYTVLPQSVLRQWGIFGLAGVPDDQVTTVLDVSPYAEAKLKALYCQRNHVLDYARSLAEDHHVQWDAEYFALAASTLKRTARREKDLFAGLR